MCDVFLQNIRFAWQICDKQNHYPNHVFIFFQNLLIPFLHCLRGSANCTTKTATQYHLFHGG